MLFFNFPLRSILRYTTKMLRNIYKICSFLPLLKILIHLTNNFSVYPRSKNMKGRFSHQPKIRYCWEVIIKHERRRSKWMAGKNCRQHFGEGEARNENKKMAQKCAGTLRISAPNGANQEQFSKNVLRLLHTLWPFPYLVE